MRAASESNLPNTHRTRESHSARVDDERGPSHEVDQPQGAGHYVYDGAGNLTQTTYPDAFAVTRTYDDDERLASVASGGQTTGYGYDAASNLTTTTLPSGNGYVGTRTYDRAGRLTGVTNKKGTSTLSAFAWALDPDGNPTTSVRTGATSETDTYSYDNLDRLTGVCFQTSCPNQNDPFIRWTYDDVGNRLSEARPSGTKNYTYNASDQLTQAGSTTYTYDANGNEKTAGSTTFNYDMLNQLISTTSGSTTTTYTYDGLGKRLQASTGSQASKKTNYLWDVSGDLPQIALERGEPVDRFLRALRADPLRDQEQQSGPDHLHEVRRRVLRSDGPVPPAGAAVRPLNRDALQRPILCREGYQRPMSRASPTPMTSRRPQPIPAGWVQSDCRVTASCVFSRAQECFLPVARLAWSTFSVSVLRSPPFLKTPPVGLSPVPSVSPAATRRTTSALIPDDGNNR
jgi:YD repeat-containing protein